MGYVCPVCTTEEADGVHLANHFAVTASLGRDDHIEWLETHAPDWNELSPDELAEIVSEHARKVETPEFEYGSDRGGAPSLEAELAAQSRQPGRGSTTQEPSSEAQGAIEEARELTRQMYESTETDGTDESSDDRSAEPNGDTAEESTAGSAESDNENL